MNLNLMEFSNQIQHKKKSSHLQEIKLSIIVQKDITVLYYVMAKQVPEKHIQYVEKVILIIQIIAT